MSSPSVEAARLAIYAAGAWRQGRDARIIREAKEGALAEDRCEACGKAVHTGDLRPVMTTERRRLFKGSQAGQGGGSLYETVEAPREMRVCEACAARLEAGESVHAIRSRRVNRQMILFALLLVLIALLTPILLPYVRTALFLNT